MRSGKSGGKALGTAVYQCNRDCVGRVRGRGWGLTFGNPDFVKYAESYGARGTCVKCTEELVPTLEAAFNGGGVHLVVVPIDYSENTRVLVEELSAQELEMA
jgi:acetolactate synthase I/II/III large subunit